MDSLIPPTIDVRNVLEQVDSAFRKCPLPNLVTTYPRNFKDYESRQVQKQLGGRDREDRSSYDISMIIIDHELINDQALLHYLPRLLRGILLDNIFHEDLLLSRLRLIDRSKLDPAGVVGLDLVAKLLKEVSEYRTKLE